jgi:endonuclease/exonuclease/phosphatase family metal-dependent hydrolase
VRVVRIITWNVLHRVHAVNWNEAPVAAFPDERVRMEGIARRVGAWLTGEADVVCLQEVSGDQLALLRSAARSAQVFEHLYPRLPRIRGEGGPVLTDATEHLVTLAVRPEARALAAHTFASDPGKGFLVVTLGDDVRIVNTHVSFGANRAAKQLARVVESAVAPAIVVGDFNASAEAVQVDLGPAFSLSDLRGQRVTRIPTGDRPGRVIDHVAVTGGAITDATVLDDELLSDHAPVAATVRID